MWMHNEFMGKVNVQCVGESMLLDGYVVRAQEMVAVVQGRLWKHRPPNEAACALWIFYQVNKDGEA